jgi:hypothetical protein
MENTRDDLAAAPPDDGHLGSFTRPEDTMQRVDRDAGQQPATDQSAAERGGHGGSGALWLWGIAFAIVVAFFLAYAFARG